MARIWLTFRPNDLPVVTARIGKDHFKALVDTGAKLSVITPSLAAGYDLTVSGHGRLIGILQQSMIAPQTIVSNVGLASITLEPFRAFIADLEHLRLGIQMIIGINALRNRRIQIDLPAGRLYILE